MTAIPNLSANPRAAVPVRKDTSKTLLDAWKVLRKRWAWMVTLALATIGAAGFYTAGLQRIYLSSCVIEIDPKPPKPLGQEVQAIVDVGNSSYWANSEYNKTQFQIIQGRAVAEETVRRLGLHRNPAFLQGLSPNQKPADGAAQETSVAAAAQMVRGHLVVEPIRDSRLVTVSYRDPDPQRAHQILSTLVGVYVDRNIDVALDSTSSAAEWLRGQVDNLKQELDGSELALHEYKVSNRILSASLDDQSNMLRQEMQQLSSALTAVRVRRTQVAAQARELTDFERQGSEWLPKDDVLASETLQRLRETLSQAVAERDSLIGSGKGEMHPLVVAASARVNAAQDALQHEIKNVREAVQRDLRVIDQEIASLSELFEQAQGRALSLGKLEIEYRRLDRNKLNTEKLYSMVLERSKESDLTLMMRFNNIQVIEPPQVPELPVSPRVPLNMGIGVLCGLALGLMGAFGREMFDQSVKTAADVEDLGITLLGVVPLLGESRSATYGRRQKARRRQQQDARTELIVHADSTNAVAEAARGVRTNLAFMSPDKPFRSLLVASGGPSEGKTTVACWLAIVMAQAGHKVVLVDCDLRRPRLHRVFNFTNDRGVTNALVERSTLADAIRPTEVPGLSVLLSGPRCPNPAETLQSKSFETLLADLLATYDRVVIDSPPVGPVTDAVILSTRVDATLLVVRALFSARDMVRQAKRLLQDVRSNLAGAVLNAADQHRQGYPYYRYYGRHDADEAPSQEDAT
ncbi:MAG TPA: polysaccharide biosynthesis tyrosine autokinase [Polyangiaceae bacterium]|nr:polysaccharide biosynthesis tyrosine autokinase [Polyangiaceae bacterium]